MFDFEYNLSTYESGDGIGIDHSIIILEYMFCFCCCSVSYQISQNTNILEYFDHV
jgi:hypothetical protein